MFRQSVVSSVIACQLAWSSHLYLLTGTQSGKSMGGYASDLYRVTDDKVTIAEEIVPGRVGTEWIGLSYDWRKAVILTKYDPQAARSTVIVIDFDRGRVVKRCESPPAVETSLIYSYLADMPQGPSFNQLMAGSEIKRDDNRAMVLDPRVPCGSSFSTFRREPLLYLTEHGIAGLSYAGSNDAVNLRLDQETGNITGGLYKDPISTGHTVPRSLWRDMDWSDAWILVNDSRATVVALMNRKSHRRFLVKRKGDGSWSILPFEGDATRNVRGFGRYVTATEARKWAPGATTPGADKWRKGERRSGTSLAGLLNSDKPDRREVLPGILYVYDIETTRMLRIDTKDGDSEVLLVDSRSVYYRVHDRLFSATIEDDRIGTPRLLATDEVIQDAHWALIGP